MEILSHSPAETEEAAAGFAKQLKPGDVIAFCGDLGAGKTTFVRGLARGLGLTGHVTSPTFAIVNVYEGAVPLYHFDVYRLHGEEDLEGIGFFEMLESGGISAIEWSETIAPFLPPAHYRVSMEPGADENERRIRIEWTGKEVR